MSFILELGADTDTKLYAFDKLIKAARRKLLFENANLMSVVNSTRLCSELWPFLNPFWDTGINELLSSNQFI